MSQNLKFFIFFSSIFILIDLYTWQGIKLLSQSWTDKSKLILKMIYWGYTGFNFVFFLVWRMAWVEFSTPALRIILAITFIVLFAKILWCVFILIDDIIRLFRWGGEKIFGTPAIVSTGTDVPVKAGISRLKFINYIGLGIGSTFATSSIYGIAVGAHNYKIKRKKLSIKGLPKSFEGLKLIQISDIHSGSFWNREAVEKGIKLLTKENADMIFFTGDLVNDLSSEMDTWKSTFSQIQAPLGVYSILGNHDYGDYYQWHDKEPRHLKRPAADKSHMSPDQMENLKKMHHVHKELGWNLLLDEHRIIEKNGEKIAVLGVENWSSKVRFPKYGSLKEAHKGTENIPVKLLLSHDPSHWKSEVLVDFPEIQATFSGHTHGMQFGVDSKYYRWSPVKFVYPEWIDLYTEGHQHLYVNRGFGYLGFPGRVGVFPEISVFTLTGV